MLSGEARIRTLADGAHGAIRVVVVGWFIVFSLLGSQATVAMGARTAAAASNRGAPTEEEEHASRSETPPTRTAIRLFRRKSPSRLISHARASMQPTLQASFPALKSRAVAPPASEHAMRNSIGAPLRC
jgi:hypothetical protein